MSDSSDADRTGHPAAARPPVAPRHPVELRAHGETRVDPYYWLRDDDRQDPQVLSHLQAENAWTQAVLAPVQSLREALYQDLVSRLAPDDSSVPVLDRGYWYYARYEADREYAIHARRHRTMDAPEEILLDENERAAGQDFYELGDLAVSDDAQLLAWTEDTRSRGDFRIHVRHIASGEELGLPRIDDTSGDLAWAADNRTLFYITREPETLRPWRVWRLRVDRPREAAVLVYEEPDSAFYMMLSRTRDERWVQIDLASTLTTEVRLLDAQQPTATPTPFLTREEGHEYSVETAGDTVYVLSNWQAPDYRLFRAVLGDAEDRRRWELLVPERPDVLLADFAVFDTALVLEEMAEGISRLRVLPRGVQDRPSLDAPDAWVIETDAPASVAAIDDNPSQHSTTLRYRWSSLAMPDTVMEIDLTTRVRRALKRDFAGPGFDPAQYMVERLQVRARDGTNVPVTLLRRHDMRPDGTHPLYLNGYGAYGIVNEPGFTMRALPLVDRGFVYAIAHVRGGQEKGRRWYDQGRTARKQNSFTDYIDVADALVEQGWSAPDGLVGSGRSAGGLLIAAVANMRPDRFAALVAGVPFVDVLTSMLDETIPLTTFEYDEWGDPRRREDYERMRAWSPYDQVREQAYPPMLVTAGLWDPAVQYWEPAKWVARLRTVSRGGAPLLLYTDMEAGHRGSAARFERLRDFAMEYAFLIGIVGLGRAE